MGFDQTKVDMVICFSPERLYIKLTGQKHISHQHFLIKTVYSLLQTISYVCIVQTKKRETNSNHKLKYCLQAVLSVERVYNIVLSFTQCWKYITRIIIDKSFRAMFRLILDNNIKRNISSNSSVFLALLCHNNGAQLHIQIHPVLVNETLRYISNHTT